MRRLVHYVSVTQDGFIGSEKTALTSVARATPVASSAGAIVPQPVVSSGARGPASPRRAARLFSGCGTTGTRKGRFTAWVVSPGVR